jgi:hypothetical protein
MRLILLSSTRRMRGGRFVAGALGMVVVVLAAGLEVGLVGGGVGSAPDVVVEVSTEGADAVIDVFRIKDDDDERRGRGGRGRLVPAAGFSATVGVAKTSGDVSVE